jgi:hypothetical protein
MREASADYLAIGVRKEILDSTAKHVRDLATGIQSSQRKEWHRWL